MKFLERGTRRNASDGHRKGTQLLHRSVKGIPACSYRMDVHLRYPDGSVALKEYIPKNYSKEYPKNILDKSIYNIL